MRILVSSATAVLVGCSATLALAADYTVTEDGSGADYSAVVFNSLTGTDYAGDTFYFSGEFTTRIRVHIGGTAGSPVTLDGFQGGDCDPLHADCTSSALLTRGMWAGYQISGPDYLRIVDFRMQNSTSVDACFALIPDPAGSDDASHIDHVEVMRNHVFETPGTLFYFRGGRYGVIENNKFVHFGQNATDAVQGVNFIEVDNTVIRGNEFGHDEMSYPSGCTSANTVEVHGCHNQLWEYNDIYGAPNQAGVAFKEWGPMGDIVFRFNKVHDNGETGVSWGGGTDPLSGLYAYGNHVYGNPVSGLSAHDDGDDSYFWSNVVHDNGDHGFCAWDRGQGSPDNITLFNNTFARNGADDIEYVRGGIVLVAGSAISAKNNVFLDNRPGAGSSIYSQIVETGQQPELEHNTLFHNGGAATWFYDGAERDLAAMQGTYNREDDDPAGEVADPGLADPDGADDVHGTADDDYTLTVAGVVDSGADLSQCFTVDIDAGSYATITVCFEDGLSEDTDWTTVPPTVVTAKQGDVGSGWDRGAYIYGSASVGGAGGAGTGGAGGTAGAGGTGGVGGVAGGGALGTLTDADDEGGCGCKVAGAAERHETNRAARLAALAVALGLCGARRRRVRRRR